MNEGKTKTVIIDPFFTGNPAATTTAEAVSPDALIISHGHGDHVGDLETVADLWEVHGGNSGTKLEHVLLWRP